MHFENEIEYKILVTYVIAKVSAFFIFGLLLHFLEMRQEGGDAREHTDRAHG